jgi:hypothetical protein
LDFIRFGAIPSSVLAPAEAGGKVIACLSNAYSFYYALKTVSNDECPNGAIGSSNDECPNDCLISLKEMIEIVACEAAKEGFDLFNSLDVMESSKEILEECLFAPGDGKLNHYIFNWKIRHLEAKEIGFLFF